MPVSRGRLPLITWADHVARWRDCHRCPLGDQRSSIVLARGTVPCDVVFIGEAPGVSEDAIGLPFVGPAGELLDNDYENKPGIIQRALATRLVWSDAKKSNVWVVDVTYALINLVACFPREAKLFGNNEPTPDEIRACRPRLTEFVNIARPRLVVRVGKLATAWADYTSGMKYLDIVHPAAILRMPLAQRQMAAQKSVVVLRSAVADMVQSNCRNFTNWRCENAGIQSSGQPVAYSPDHIPF